MKKTKTKNMSYRIKASQQNKKIIKIKYRLDNNKRK